MKTEQKTYIVWSGEGERGYSKIVHATPIGIKRIVTAESAGGDRWAHAAESLARDPAWSHAADWIDGCVEARDRAVCQAPKQEIKK